MDFGEQIIEINIGYFLYQNALYQNYYCLILSHRQMGEWGKGLRGSGAAPEWVSIGRHAPVAGSG